MHWTQENNPFDVGYLAVPILLSCRHNWPSSAHRLTGSVLETAPPTLTQTSRQPAGSRCFFCPLLLPSRWSQENLRLSRSLEPKSLEVWELAFPWLT